MKITNKIKAVLTLKGIDGKSTKTLLGGESLVLKKEECTLYKKSCDTFAKIGWIIIGKADEQVVPPVIKKEVVPPVVDKVIEPPVVKKEVVPPVVDKVIEPPVVKKEVVPPVVDKVIEPPLDPVKDNTDVTLNAMDIGDKKVKEADKKAAKKRTTKKKSATRRRKKA